MGTNPSGAAEPLAPDGRSKELGLAQVLPTNYTNGTLPDTRSQTIRYNMIWRIWAPPQHR